ncbi:MAG: restriction endonuclease, partial [Rhizobiales bacterium]|nr:restriction endonuclease [Hyphomicrobiales bacterium]
MPAFSFFSRTVDEFRNRRRRFVLSRDDIAAINPNTNTVPIFRTSADADLTARIHARVPVLIDEAKGKDGSPWGLSFIRMFDMSNDSGLFRTAAQLTEAGFTYHGGDWVMAEGSDRPQRSVELSKGLDAHSLTLEGGGGRRSQRYVPLYEAKMIHHFDHRWATYEGDGSGDDDARYPSPVEKKNAEFEISPRYWAPEQEVSERLISKQWGRGWLMGHRGITSATNERTLVAAVFPRCAVGNSLPAWVLRPDIAITLAGALSANATALVLDFVVRQKVGGANFNFFYIEQFPILPPSSYLPNDLAFIVPRVLELTYISHSMAPFARDLGYDGPPLAWDENRRAQLRAELDAWYARAYGLTRDELRY